MPRALGEPVVGEFWARAAGQFPREECGSGIQQSVRLRAELRDGEQIVIPECAQRGCVERHTLERRHEGGEVLERCGEGHAFMLASNISSNKRYEEILG